MVGKSMFEQLAMVSFRCGSILHHFSDIANKGKYIVLLNHTWPPSDDIVI
jgi:hypothetical protein